MDATSIKHFAKHHGADLVGIAPAERWADGPAKSNPRHIQPRCQSVVVIGRRIPRGAFRGVEEGTSFGNTYGLFGRDWHEMAFLTRTIHEVALAIEAAGAEAVPLLGGGTGLDAKALAHAAGLGAVGKGGFFLTPAYGHRQRFGLILADIALDGDPVVEPDLCTGCDACRTACPLSAMTAVEGGCHFTIDLSRCSSCANGYALGAPNAYESQDRLAAACGRACLVAVEGKTKASYQHLFRKRAIWTRDSEGRPSVHALQPKGSAQ